MDAESGEITHRGWEIDIHRPATLRWKSSTPKIVEGYGGDSRFATSVSHLGDEQNHSSECHIFSDVRQLSALYSVAPMVWRPCEAQIRRTYGVG